MRPDLFFGGSAILNAKGKEGNANSTIINKLVETGGLLARESNTAIPIPAVQSARDLSQYTAMVCRIAAQLGTAKMNMAQQSVSAPWLY